MSTDRDLTIYNKPRPIILSRVSLHTVKNAQCIVSNIMLERNEASLFYTLSLNTPLRIWNCIRAFQKRDFVVISLEVAAFSSLFFPYGRHFSMLIDTFSQLFFLYRNYISVSPLEREWQEQLRTIRDTDCSNRSVALEVLSLTEQQVSDRDLLNRRYLQQKTEWDRRIPKASAPLAEQYKLLSRQTEAAYHALST